MLIQLIREGFDIFSVLIYILSVLMIIFLINPIHECAHGLAAYKLGDRTAKNMGRLTLNPLAHLDYMGAIIMLIIGFGWAKPVPVNFNNFKKPRLGMFITALAGPLSNLLAAVLGGLIVNTINTVMVKNGNYIYYDGELYYKLGYDPGFMKYVLMFLMFFIMINICLAVFNLLPIPPLDGSKILMSFLPNRIIYKISGYEMYISIALFVIVVSGAAANLLYPVQEWLYDGILKLTALPFSWAW